MFFVPDAWVFEWQKHTEGMVPASVRIRCPHCRQTIGFSTSWVGDANAAVCTSVSKCVLCRKQVVFTFIKSDGELVSNKRGRLYAYPSPEIRSPIPEVDHLTAFSNKLARDYTSALRALNLDEWTPTVASCRRALDELVHMLIPQDAAVMTLASDASTDSGLEQIFHKWGDMLQHIRRLTESDLAESEIDREHATRMLDLVESLMQSFFILPLEVDTLLERIVPKAEST